MLLHSDCEQSVQSLHSNMDCSVHVQHVAYDIAIVANLNIHVLEMCSDATSQTNVTSRHASRWGK
jgi:hypothetical protein